MIKISQLLCIVVVIFQQIVDRNIEKCCNFFERTEARRSLFQLVSAVSGLAYSEHLRHLFLVNMLVFA